MKTKNNLRFLVSVSFSILFFNFLMAGCASTKNTKGALTPEESALATKQNQDPDTLVILAINDFHGSLAPAKKKLAESENASNPSYTVGGGTIFASHVKLLKKEFGDRLLVVDAGDEWQGSLDSNLTEGASVVSFFNQIGVAVAAVGNHEFDFGPVGLAEQPEGDLNGAFKARLKDAKYPYISANMVDRATGKFPKIENLFKSVIKEVAGIKVGIIGLTTIETPFTTRPDFIRGYGFGDIKGLRDVTVQEAKNLRKRGAEIVLIAGHIPVLCDGHGKAAKKPDDAMQVWTPSTHQTACNRSDEAAKLLSMLPAGTIDGAITGHSHTIVHHWINHIPTVQAGAYGIYYNLLFLKFDRKAKKVVPAETVIQGPVPICEKVFENQQNCNGKEPVPPEGRGRLVTPIFRNHEIYPDPEALALLEQTFKTTDEAKKKVLGEAVRAVPHGRFEESAMGNLVADAIREAAHTDFAFTNPGGLRAPFERGPITYEAVFKTLPFDNTVAVIKLSGRELKNILRTADAKSHGFFPTSGLKVTLLKAQADGASKDLDRDGKISNWEIDRLVSVQDEAGNPIENSKMYTLATNDFLIRGGDGLGWAMKQIPESRITIDAAGPMRDVVARYLEIAGPINSIQNPLVKPDHPRVLTVSEQAAKRVKKQKKARISKKARRRK